MIIREKHFKAVLAIACLSLLFFSTNRSYAQASEWNTWASLELTKDFGDKFKAYLSPQIRFANKDGVDEYFLETGVKYDLFNFLEVSGNYRYLVNERKTKSTEYFHRIAFDLTGKYEINRLEFALRTRYTNYDELDNNEGFNDATLRYRLKSEYDIPNMKLTPAVGVEFFHQLENKEINKIRYILGAAYKINKKHKVELDYLLHTYPLKDGHTNILALEYKIDF
ncbi:DUF2490 domain-containing protein [Sunxiuqinia sp. sy24]|uniref:DUF2490 domain-containing protein n=1 Tax=Sunxiuqinia sp. sy24 TaxID=3461495 RepID=UPI00404533F5